MSKTKVDMAEALRLAGDASRLRILCVLFEGKDPCVMEIGKKLGMSTAIVSHHLQVLSRAGVLVPEREGKRVCYTLAKEPFVRDLKGLICKYKRSK